jgi:hypothetical protein
VYFRRAEVRQGREKRNMLKVFTRENSGTLGGKKYIFRSSTMATFTIDELVHEMATFNTTITEADTLAVLNVMKRIVVKYVEQGYSVQTPLGVFSASASGTIDDIMGAFEPNSKDNNHDIRMLFRPDVKIISDVLANTSTERTSNRLKTFTSIDKVMNAAGESVTNIKTGDMIIVYGDYLKFNVEKEDQGVFLEAEDKSVYRLKYYTQNTAGRIEARIETGIPAGIYTLSVHNVPTVTPAIAKYRMPLTIEA